LEQEGAMLNGVILDLNLVTHSGLDILATIRANPAFAGLPVLILTSSSSPRDHKRAESRGVTAYLLKPMELERYMQIGRQIAEMFSSLSAEERAPRSSAQHS